MSWSDWLGGAWDLISDNPEVVGGALGLIAGSQDGENQTVTNKPYLYQGQEEGIANVLNMAKQEYEAGGPQFYPGQQVAGLDPNVIAGQNQQLGSLGVQQQLADLGTFGAGDLLQGGAGRIDGFNLPGQVAQNQGPAQVGPAGSVGRVGGTAGPEFIGREQMPGDLYNLSAGQRIGGTGPRQEQIGFGIDESLQSAVSNPIIRNLEERLLPAADLQATSQGAFGGTRHQLMRNNAARDATGQMSDAIARANLQARSQSIQQRAGDINADLAERGQDVAQRSTDLNFNLGQRAQDVQNRSADINAALSQRNQDISQSATAASNRLNQRNQDINQRSQDINSLLSQRNQDINQRGQDLNNLQTQRAQDIGQRSTDINAMLQGRNQDINQNQLYNQAVGAGINAIPGAMTAQMAPGRFQQEIGNQRTDYEQRLINADRDRFNFNQQRPITALNRLQNRMTLSAPQGNVETTQGQQANLATALGSGLSFANTLGSMFAGSGGAGSAGQTNSSNPASWGTLNPAENFGTPIWR